LFQSKYAEDLTKTNPRVIFTIYVPIITAMLVYSVTVLDAEWYRAAGFYFLGMFFWTFFEYIMHRFAFHLHSDDPKVQRITYTTHGVHHEFPRDKDRLFMPPLPSLVIAVIMFSIFFLIMKYNAFMFFPGF